VSPARFHESSDEQRRCIGLVQAEGGKPREWVEASFFSLEGRSYAAHAVVERWAEAAWADRLPVGLVSYSELEKGWWGRLPVAVRNVLNPARCVPRLRRATRCAPLVLLRDFLTVPFALWAPALRSRAGSIALILHHNVQRAATRVRDRAALELLLRLGFRFIVPESDAGVVAVLGRQGRDRVLTLPFGLVDRRNDRVRREPIVTVMGADRPEKGNASILERVRVAMAGRREPPRVRLASRSSAALAEASRRGWEAVDTSSEESWWTCLSESTVLVLDYSKEAYYYRPSATVADAAAAGAAVVVPDFPVLRDQVRAPCAVGATFGGDQSLDSALDWALRLGAGPGTHFDRYLEHRSAAAIAATLREFLGHLAVVSR